MLYADFVFLTPLAGLFALVVLVGLVTSLAILAIASAQALRESS